MKIYLIGFMGSGKSSIGKRIAKSLEYEFIDLDKLVEAEANQTINEIFSDSGEDHFRTLEKAALNTLKGNEHLVVATGGGTPLYGDNMQFMISNGTTIYLELSPKILHERLLQSRAERPLIKDLSDHELREFIEDKLSERSPTYLQAHHKVNAAHITNAAEEITKLKFRI